MAGERVLVYVLPRDGSPGTTRWTGGERVSVAARGPAETPFEPLDVVGAFAATLTAAGAYSVAALVGDCSAAGWPRTLQVVAGPCDPDKCVSGDALKNCATGRPLSLLVRAADRFGNPRSMGGDMLELFARPRRLEAEGGGVGARVDAAVTDNEDGTYGAVVVLEEATKHDVHVVNGLSDASSRYFLAPSLAPLSAAECVVRGVGARTRDPALCETSVVFVQPANPIRAMSGREGAVTMVVHTPSGLALNNPARFSAETRVPRRPCTGWRRGAHSVAVSLDGELLPGCPFLVEVRDPEDEDLGEEEDAVSNKRVKSSTTTTTTTTVTTRSANGAVVTDTRVAREASGRRRRTWTRRASSASGASA